MKISKSIYKLSSEFPIEERYWLISQIRRASVSIISNIAEWNSKSSDKHFRQYLETSLWSVFEVEAQLELAKELSYVSNINKLIEELNELWKMINWLVKSLSNSKL